MRCPLELGLLETKVASQLTFKNNIHLITVKHTSVLFHTLRLLSVSYVIEALLFRVKILYIPITQNSDT